MGFYWFSHSENGLQEQANGTTINVAQPDILSAVEAIQ